MVAPAKSYEDYQRQYDVVMKFGQEALEKVLKAEADKGHTITRDFVLNEANKIIAGPEMSNKIKQLNEVALRLESVQTPRAVQRPELKNEGKLEQSGNTQRNYKQTKWEKKLGEAAVTIANDINDNPQASITNQCDRLMAQLANKLKAENKLRMPAPSPTRKIRPDAP